MKTKGFTLIELMIVVSIIGVLVSVVAPALRGHPERPAEIIVPTVNAGVR